MSDNTVACSPLLRSSRPTAGPTISVPDLLKVPTVPCLSAFSTASAVVLSDAPDSAPTCGTRIITSRREASP